MSHKVNQARVKSVLSGDTLVLTQVANPKAERLLSLAFVSAPRMKREGDEPFGFVSREHLIKNLVGKVVQFRVLYTIPTGANREYGVVTLEDNRQWPDESLREGWSKVRDDAERKAEESDLAKSVLEGLEAAQSKAKADSKGVWSSEGGVIEVSYELPNPKAFVEDYKSQKLHGIVERVLTGDRVILRLLTSQNKHLQTIAVIAGIRAPATKRTTNEGTEQPGEPFGEEALLFLESRVLQRTLTIEPVGVTPQGLLVCKVAHKQGGDMANHLLTNGLARCVDHHSTMLGPEMAKLREAERSAKSKKLNIFKDHVAPKAAGGESEVTVVRVQTADTIYIRSRNGAERRINLSSVRQPKPSDATQAPFQAEAKEYLRKRLIGKHIKITVDGKKPASDGFEERDVATVTQGGKNVALALVEAGYASVIRHKRDDTDRSPFYDDLLAAEEKAIQEKKGMWSGKPQAAKQYVDYSESLQKAKIQASVLQRQKRVPAIVDFVKGASRFTVLIPRENAKLTLVLSCLRAPRSARNANEKSEPFGQEAHDFANRKCQQRDVEIDVEGTDKVGGFIGTLWVNRENFSKLLLEEGLASVHAYSAEQSPNGVELFAAEQKAKDARKGIWQHYDPAEEADEGEDATANGAAVANSDAPQTRTLDYKEVSVTHIDPSNMKLKIQIAGTSAGALEDLMTKFRSFHLSNNNALPADPKAGDYVSAKFSEDGLWYRARIRRNDRERREAEVLYIDYGNQEKLPWKALRPLPGQFDAKTLRAQAVDAQLSFVQFPTNEEYLVDAVDYLFTLIGDKPVIANIDSADKDGLLHLTLFERNMDVKETESINALVVDAGLAMVPAKLRPWEKAAAKLVDDLKSRQEAAKQARKGMWEYGDITED